MRRLALILAALATPAFGQQPAPAPPAAAPDYTQPATWLCRPGQEERCTSDMDVLVVDADGNRTTQTFQAAAHPAVDCFYVYPTVSRESTPYADLTPSPEIVQAARAQVGHLAAACRLFVPIYRQTTLAGLSQHLASEPPKALRWDGPYADVLAAWRQYVAHDNQGRGVVLIGHSQGTILLQRLIAEEIDGKPVQARLVSAFLAGDPGLQVPQGQAVGGTFRHVPLCSAAAQTGCAYVWSSYAASDEAPERIFGHSDGKGLSAACVSPAAPGGGTGSLKAYVPNRFAPSPAWIEMTGQLTASCIEDAHGDVLRVSVVPGPNAGLVQGMVQRASARPGWGLHVLDMNLVQGNILDVLTAQAASWQAAHPGS